MKSVFAVFFVMFVALFAFIVWGVSVSPVASGWLPAFLGSLSGVGFSALCWVMEDRSAKRRE